jgi:hypothetical protein
VSNRISTILASFYGALVVLSIVPIFTGDDALNGIFAVVLGLPWTIVLSRVADAINPSLSNGLATGIAIALVAGFTNVAIIYVVSRWIVQQVHGR